MIEFSLRPIVCSFLCLLLLCQPTFARDVFFSSENSNPLLHSQLKPYCIDARKKVEALWDSVDPHTGGQVHLVFVIGADGRLLNIFPRTLEDNPLNERAVFSVTQCGAFPVLPPGQDTLVMTAIFKSKKPAYKPEYSKIGDAVIIAALIGLTGLAIYGLLKLNSSNSGTYNTASPNYHWVRPYTTSSGVFVPGHYQTNADDSTLNNYSTYGNFNPWTGMPGWVRP